MTDVGSMDGSEPGLASATLEALGSLLPSPSDPSAERGIQGELTPDFLASMALRHVSKAHGKPPPRACGCKKAEEGGGDAGEKSFI